MKLTSFLRDPSTAKMPLEQATQSMDLTGRQQETIAFSCSTSCIMAGQSNNHTPSTRDEQNVNMTYTIVAVHLQQLVLNTAIIPFSIPT